MSRKLHPTQVGNVVELTPHLTLVTDLFRGPDHESRHSSVWDSTDGQLRLRFHQGTFVADQ